MRLLNRLIGKALGTFVAHGVSIDDEGRLCLPDGLVVTLRNEFVHEDGDIDMGPGGRLAVASGSPG